MKRTAFCFFSSLLLALLMVGAGRPFHEAQAIDPNWLAEATTDSPGGFAYSVEITPESLVAVDEYFPSSTTTDPYYTYAYDTGRSGLSFEWEMTGMYVPMAGEARADYMTLGFTTDNFGFLNSYRNMGRLTKVAFDIDEDQYEDIETELAGAIGLQLREGKNADYSDAENEDSGPTYTDFETGIVEWDLTWRVAEHPEHDPFFTDESRLDDISNFRLITLEEVHFDRVYVEGYHFFEAFNDTPYYYAMWEENYVSEEWGLSFNVDNRTDTDYEIDASAAFTPTL